MANGWLSLPSELFAGLPLSAHELSAFAAGAAPPGATAHPAAGPEIRGQWRSAAGAAIGAEFSLGRLESDLLEHPGADGRYARSRVARPPLAPADIPDGAEALHLMLGAQALAETPAEALAAAAAPDALGPPQRLRLGSANAAMALPVISERFATWAEFLARGQALHDWIATQPPFDGLPDALALELFFWPSDPARGLFNTPDKADPDGRLFYGDRVLARRLLAPFIAAFPVSVILIDSVQRGGAGGQPGYSAWASVGAAPDEPWQAIALHEVGHGFGLADEYVDDDHAQDPRPANLEPNIADDAHPAAAPWAVTLPAAPAPSGGLDATGPAGVGTFQGARYRIDLYRPTLTCLMRQTTAPFCPVCCAHIAAAATPG